MATLLMAGLLAMALPCLYSYAVAVAHSRPQPLKNKRICLLIAHPDDEAMFFAPTLLSLTRPETGNHVKVLCLSAGNANGLGETRKKELVKSCTMLGLGQDDVFVLDSPEFQDSLTVPWDRDDISTLLCKRSAPRRVAREGSDNNPPSATVDVLITFDRYGVSNHPNHISLYHGARTFISTIMFEKSSWESPVDLYALKSVSTWHKYTGFLGALLALSIARTGMSLASGGRPNKLLFVNHLVGDRGLPAAWAAMTKAHKSQMVWFRWGWIAFSRYMVVNELRLEHVGGTPEGGAQRGVDGK